MATCKKLKTTTTFILHEHLSENGNRNVPCPPSSSLHEKNRKTQQQQIIMTENTLESVNSSLQIVGKD